MPSMTRAALAACLAVAVPLGVATSVGATTLSMPMMHVPGGGEPNGPAHDFWMGRYEVTVAQYLAFLNDAEANTGDERGAYMVFDANTGDVGLVDGSYTDGIFDLSDCNYKYDFGPHYGVVYDPNLPAGSRYAYDPNNANHPIVGVSWIGAVKFCNWLTLGYGLGSDQRCYAEGEGLADWHPVTIDGVDWIDRDLNDAERQALIDGYVGFRLPMDGLALDQHGFIDGSPNPYNEWYKAAGYDPNAPATQRTGEHGEIVPPYHWEYGYGSDELDLTKANFLIYDANVPGGIDPNCARVPVAVGSYAANNGNPWGIDDLSGNVYEWHQDYCNTLDPDRHATHGKAYNGGEPAAALRHYRTVWNGTTFVGFRVVQCGGYELNVEVAIGASGSVLVEPNQPVYPPGASVTLTGQTYGDRSFDTWWLYDPNHPNDANFATTDSNNPITIAMLSDRHVAASFKCGSEVGAMLPMILAALGACVVGRRYRR